MSHHRRRLAGIGLPLSLVALTAAAQPASAHFCATPVRAPVNEPASVTIGVDNDSESPVTSVEIDVPVEFDLDRALDVQPWTATRVGRKITYSGGEITIGTCSYFSLSVTARKKGILAIPITTRAADGTVREFRGRDMTQPLPAQLVYAGVDPEPTGSTDEGSGSETGPIVLGSSLVAVGLGGFVFVMWRNGELRKRRPSARAATSRSGRRPSSAKGKSKKKKKAQRQAGRRR